MPEQILTDMTTEQRLINMGFAKDPAGVWTRGETGLSNFILLNLTYDEVENILDISERREKDRGKIILE